MYEENGCNVHGLKFAHNLHKTVGAGAQDGGANQSKLLRFY